MLLERYHSNAAALGEDLVNRLSSSHVFVQGNNVLAQSVLYNLACLGVGSISHETDSDVMQTGGILQTLGSAVKSDFNLPSGPVTFSDTLFSVAPHINYEQTRKSRPGSFLIDTTALEGFSRSSHEQSLVSLFYGALLADEARKHVGLVSKYEERFADGIVPASVLDVCSLFNRAAVRSQQRVFDRVLVIGGGGLGTYCTYVLAQRNCREIILCEPDVVEEKNLNRQLFYAGCIDESKADALSRRLSTQCASVIPRKEYFNNRFDAGGLLDAIFCCTDTLESRIAACEYAQRLHVPLVEGACTPTMGSITTYVPDKTKSICEQRDLRELLRLHNEQRQRDESLLRLATTSSCTQSANPSVIGPNMLIGSLMAAALDYRYDAVGSQLVHHPQVFLNLLRNNKFSHGGK